MTPLLDRIRSTMAGPRGTPRACLVCGRAVHPGQEQLRLRGGAIVHRACATYDMRRRRVGEGRLGYPRAR